VFRSGTPSYVVVLGTLIALGCSRGDGAARAKTMASALVEAATPPAPSISGTLAPTAPMVRPTPEWLPAALARPATIARPEAATCVTSLDVPDLLAGAEVAMAKGSPKRINILAFSLYGMGCPCYEQFGFAHNSILPFFVRGLPGAARLPPRVHGGSFTLAGYFTGRRIDTYEWYAADGVHEVKPEEGADYTSRHLEFIVEGWCFHPPKPNPDSNDLFDESIAEMRRLGVPFCSLENACSNRPEPKSLPVGPCSRNLLLRKARLLDDQSLLLEWDAAQARYREGPPHDPKGEPRDEVSVNVWRDADVSALARRYAAKRFERIANSSTWILQFDGVPRAIDAIQGLLCDHDVAAASINSISK